MLAMVEKLQNRNPLSTSIVRNAVCLNLMSITSLKEDTLCRQMKHLKTKLVSLKKISSSNGDKALQQYREFLSEFVLLNKEKIRSYDRKNRRLDEFFFHYLKIAEKYPHVAIVMVVHLGEIRTFPDVRDKGFLVPSL